MRSAGLPDVVEQGPRATPGSEALDVVGYVPPSHSMPLPEPPQMLNTSTMPPCCGKALVLLKDSSCELQRPPEMALVGVMPATLNAAFWITFPSWMEVADLFRCPRGGVVTGEELCDHGELPGSVDGYLGLVVVSHAVGV